MKQRKLGCFTTGGVIALIITLLVVGGSYAFAGGKMFLHNGPVLRVQDVIHICR